MAEFEVTGDMMEQARTTAMIDAYAVFWPSSESGWDYDTAIDMAEARDIADDAGPDAVIKKL